MDVSQNFLKEEINSATWLKKVDSNDKDEITWDLSSSVIERFNGYQTKRHELAHMEQKYIESVCILYDHS